MTEDGIIETARKHLREYGQSYLFAIVTSVLISALGGWIRMSAVTLLQVMAVLLAARTGGLYPGLLATGLCLLFSGYAHFAPTFSLRVDDADDQLALALFSIIGVSISVISELRRRAFAEKDRRHRELKILMSSIGEGVIATDLNHRIVTLNAVACEMTGWTEQEAVGRPLDEVLPVAESQQDPMSGEPSERNFKLTSRQGHTLLVERNSTPIFAGVGRQTGTVHVVRDVTGRIQALEERRNNEERFRAMIKATAQIVWTTSASGTITDDSPTWREFTGQTYQQWIGTGWLNAVHPEDRELALTAWQTAVAQKSLYSVEYRLQSAGGGYRWTSARGVPVFNRDGSIREWIGMNLDITRERLILDSLRDRERRYELVAEAANDVIWDWDLQSQEIAWNRGLHHLFGYPPELTRTDADWWYERIHPADRPRVEKSIHQMRSAAEDERWQAEYLFQRVDGSYAFVLDRGRVVREQGIPVRMVGSMLDLTERKQIEQTLSERSLLADLRAEVSSRMATAHALSEVLEGCAAAIATRLDISSVRIWLVDESADRLHAAATRNAGALEDSTIRCLETLLEDNKTLFDPFLVERRPGTIDDMREGRTLSPEEMTALAPVQAVTLDPLVVENTNVGLLTMFTARPLSPSVHQDLTTLADSIAQYIQRKRGEERLREQEALYRSIFESSNDAIMIFDAEGILVEANPFACQLHGYEYDEFIGMSGTEMIYARDEPRFKKFRDRVAQGVSFFDQGVHVRKDGSLVHVEVQGASLRYRGRPHLLAVVRDVSERRQSEQKFVELTEVSERQRRLYDTILSNSLDQVYVFDLDHRFSYANQALLNAWGKTWEQAIGKNCHQLGYPDWQVKKHTRELDQVIETRKPIRGEVPFTGANGRRIYDYIFYPVLGINGEVEAIAGTSRDVTDRKITENNLRQSEGRFRQLADAMPQIVWTATPNGYIDYYNDRWYEYTGFGPDQRGIDCWEEIVHPDDLKNWKQAWQSSVETGATFNMEVRLFSRLSGAYQWFLGKAVSAKDEFGDVVRWFGTCTDIDRQKRNEQISDFLAEASSQLVEHLTSQTTMEQVARIAVPDFADWCAIDMLDAHGKEERIALVHAESVPGQRYTEIQEFYPPQFDANRILFQSLRTGKSQLIERIDPAEPISAHVSNQRDLTMQERLVRSVLCVPLVSRGKVLGAITFAMAESGRYFDADDLQVADVVATRFTVAFENMMLYQQLQETDRRKDEFLAMLAHELRNPLAPIRSGLDLLILNAPQERSVLEVMKEQVEHLVRLVDDLLDVSRIMRGKIDLRKSTVDLHDIFERAIEAVHWAFDEKEQHFSLETPEESIPLEADPVRLVQVISNLLNNASKYTNPGGHITLKTELQSDEVRISVIDDGIGIEPELLGSVFDLFTQSSRALDRAQGGLGIGLTLVKNLVEMHSGAVQVFSDGPGAGSEFLVTLPLAKEPVVVVPPPDYSPPSRDCRILVVDDNLGAAKLLNLLLAKLGNHTIELAHDGAAALEKLQTFQPDLILLDIGLPEMDGYEVASRIRQNPQFDGTLLVALTGYGREEDRIRSRQAGFDEHIVKPPSLDLLQQMLKHPKLAAQAE